MHQFFATVFEVVVANRTCRIGADVAIGNKRLLQATTAPTDWQFTDEPGRHKSHGEFLVVGRAFPRGDVSSCAVQVDAIEKSVALFGDRIWGAASPSKPAPRAEVPLTWENAFGGPKFAHNPLGKGIAADEDGVVRLPNIEDPNQLIASPSDRPKPVGFGPIDATWPSRRKKLGTYDDAWLEERWPDFPVDLDPTYFNVAPEDQWLPEGQWWRGDEAVRFENMHPEKPVVEGKLPGVKARCFVERRGEGGAYVFHEVAMRLETLVLLPNEERAILLFRGTVPGTDEDGDDIRHLLAALEGLDEPKTFEHYKAAFEKRLDRKAAARLKDDDLLPSWVKLTSGMVDVDPTLQDLYAKEDLTSKNMRRRAEKELANVRQDLVERGLDPDAHGVPKELPPPIENLDEEAADKMLAEAEAEADVLKKQAEAMMAAEMNRARQVCAENGIDFDAKLAENKKKEGGPPKWKPDDVLVPLADAAELVRNAETPDAENKALAKLNEPGFRESLEEMRAGLIAMYRGNAQYFPAAWPLEGDEAATTREAIAAEYAAKRSFAERDLTGADLSKLDLRGADFRLALLEKADLHGANLEGADFTGAVLARADLEGAKTKGVKLAGANLAEARLMKLDLAGVDLRGAVLTKAQLGGANLHGANLDGADLAEVDLTAADLAEASAQKAQFTGATVERARFTGADLTEAVFHSLDLGGLDFSGARLEKVELHECLGEKTKFAGAHMKNARFSHIDRRSCFDGADFEKANLEHANLRDVELKGAHFAGADLGDADLSKADCEGANFHRARAKSSLWIRTKLKGARLAGANLREATLTRADLAGASLEGANLFGANLMYVHVDGATNIDRAELGQIAFRKERAK
jgi:uncharacterized protein YjbI with pentapeptide repeats